MMGVMGLPPMDYMRRSDFPPMTGWQKIGFTAFLMVVAGGAGVVSIMGNHGEVVGAFAVASVMWATGGVTLMIRRSRPAEKVDAPTQKTSRAP